MPPAGLSNDPINPRAVEAPMRPPVAEEMNVAIGDATLRTANALNVPATCPEAPNLGTLSLTAVSRRRSAKCPGAQPRGALHYVSSGSAIRSFESLASAPMVQALAGWRSRG